MGNALQVKAAIDRFTIETQALFKEHGVQKRQEILGIFEKWKLLERVESTKDSESYPSWRSVGNVVEYDEGGVPFTTLGSDTQTVKNRLFGRGVAVPRTFWEDIGNNPQWKTALQQRIQGLMDRAYNNINRMLIDLILGQNAFSAATDRHGKAIFATDHLSGSNKALAADGVATAYTTTAIETEHDIALDKFTAMTDVDGHDNLRELAPKRLLILVDPRYQRVYQTVYHAAEIGDVRVGTSTSDTGGVGTMGNVLAMAGEKGGCDVMIIGWSRLRAKTRAIYVDATNDVPGPCPVVHQERIVPTIEMDGEGSSNYFEKEETRWKVRGRGELFQAMTATKMLMIDKSGA